MEWSEKPHIAVDKVRNRDSIHVYRLFALRSLPREQQHPGCLPSYLALPWTRVSPAVSTSGTPSPPSVLRIYQKAATKKPEMGSSDFTPHRTEMCTQTHCRTHTAVLSSKLQLPQRFQNLTIKLDLGRSPTSEAAAVTSTKFSQWPAPPTVSLTPVPFRNKTQGSEQLWAVTWRNTSLTKLTYPRVERRMPCTIS